MIVCSREVIRLRDRELLQVPADECCKRGLQHQDQYHQTTGYGFRDLGYFKLKILQAWGDYPKMGETPLFL
jgi:hypothetical protein